MSSHANLPCNVPTKPPLAVAARVLLRRLQPGDLPAFQSYRRDPEVARYQGWEPQSDKEALAFLEEMSVAPLFPRGAWIQLGIANCETDALIGDIGMHVAADGRVAELGFTLSAGCQGRGLATEAVTLAIGLLFAEMDIEQVIAVSDSRNAASIRLLERLGMRFIATADVTFRGEPCIEHTYALSRPATSSIAVDSP